MNDTTILLLVIWIICGVVAAKKKDDGVLIFALVATFLIGIGYLILHDK